ncbi:PepSY domain-containing protein [Pseudaminobacter soli (ex Li et al. 2025)]|uniref:PepSY domain-containing protein n=1 Tax=Pseudaminobacter soli (ex Li et al. 2025) TaxID=1295366 RepID=A0A2P7RSK5_9HYPH|nr:PepSY domain-containing protein [Mesorhizobium soli]PSJ53214.1 PepSY domain-containing protein [Mesorhizobium soli]
MKTMILVPAVLLGALASFPAFAGNKCDVPVGEWQPREALEAKLKSDGWKIRSIKTENGCYEAYAIDAGGKKVEAYFNPKTLERVPGSSEDSEG